jgi:hypothetical protein
VRRSPLDSIADTQRGKAQAYLAPGSSLHQNQNNGVPMKNTVLCFILASAGQIFSQPNPYRANDQWGQLPPGRKLGSASAIDIDRRTGNIWVADRCGANSCSGSTLNPIFEFDPSGKLRKNFGAGMFVTPHGMYVDKNGSVWMTDQVAKDGKGNQVIEFSPEGKVLMTLGKAGVTGEGPDTFNSPPMSSSHQMETYLSPMGTAEIRMLESSSFHPPASSSKLGARKAPALASSIRLTRLPSIPKGACS